MLKITLVHFHDAGADRITTDLSQSLETDFKMKLHSFTAGWMYNSTTLELANESQEHLVFIIAGKQYQKAVAQEPLAKYLPSGFTKSNIIPLRQHLAAQEQKDVFKILQPHLPLVQFVEEPIPATSVWEEF